MKTDHNLETESALLKTPPPPVSVELEILGELNSLLTKPARNLTEFLGSIVFGGELGLFNHPVQALPVFRTTETSGYNFTYNKKMMAYVRFGITTSQYFVVQSLIISPNSSWISHYYSADGKYAFSEGPISHQFQQHPVKLMEPKCPILNHIYNILAVDYAETKSGKINTKTTYTLEKFLRKLAKTRPNELSIASRVNDGALQAIRHEMITIENDPVLNWKERFHSIKALKSERTVLVKTKRRAHQLSPLYTFPGMMIQDLADLFTRFGTRPFGNTLGILDRLLMDPLRWFGGVVKSNMGYSIALAIYSPFTFFFITQPMNPHAMWAVGNVRSAYLETTEKAKRLLGFTVVGEAVNAPSSQGPSAADASNSNAAAPTVPTANIIVGNMEVTANRSEVNQQTWDERMSNFKAVQIGYEENMEIAPRLGRLEQMETQLNWPMIIEGAWLETERYTNFLGFIEANAKDYAPAFVNFVKAEHARVDQVQLYLWDKNVRFILDHPFTLMNNSGEQTQYDYYVGRAFVQLRDMTNSLAARYRSLPMPNGYGAIAKLAQKFDAEYKAGGSVLDRLKNNSKLFSQNDPQNTDELRSYMKRQWELLYLLQNKAQEASNNGLQLYTWSVRNTAYLLQSMYSSKREEMSTLALSFRKGGIVNKLTNSPAFKKVDSQFEAQYHMMVLEFASIQKEIGEGLKKDLETTQRKKIIAGVESFLKERDILLKEANLL